MTKTHLALVVAALVALPTPVAAQMSHGETMPIVVEATRVMLGPQWMPRRLELPSTLVVQAGTVTTLPATATYDYIEVQNGGTLRVPRDRDTTLRFTHLVVLPGGYLDRGTVADPVPCKFKVDFIVRDVPIDTTIDPFQWGNGLVNFGKQTSVGCQKTAFVETSAGLVAGQTVVPLDRPLVGAQVGDEVLFTDTTAQTGAVYNVSTAHSRLETPKTITAMDATTVTLSKGLDFAHPSIVDPSGAVLLRPRIANLTRNIVIRSANEKGTPGHTADIGHGATYDVRWNALLVLGRTKAIPLNDTVQVNGVITKVGTNPAGKYAAHAHHNGSCPSCVSSGNVYIGGGGYLGDVLSGSKAGQVLHDTSDTLVEDNIVLFFKGAGFVTEDGYEVRNVIRRNLWAFNDYPMSPLDIVDAHENVTRGCPFCERSGAWFRGVMNTIERNESWNNGDAGINLFNQDQPINKYPGVPGGDPDTALNHRFDFPVSFAHNITAANRTGFEIWGVGKFPYQGLITAHNTNSQVFAVNSENIFLWLQNVRALCPTSADGVALSVGLHSSMGYVSELTVEQGSWVKGCAIGIAGGGGIGVDRGPGIKLFGTILQNQVNLDMVPLGIRHKDVLHVPLRNYPHQYIVMSDFPVWNGTGPTPGPLGGNVFIPQQPSRYVIENWQGTGKDYKLAHLHARGSLPVWYSGPFPNQFNPPEKGITVEQSWNTYGLVFGGDLFKDADIVPLEGLIDGLARLGLAFTPTPPKAIVTFPTKDLPAPLVPDGCPGNGQVCTGVQIQVANTGDPLLASRTTCVLVDGGGIGAGPDADCLTKDDPDIGDRSFVTTKIAPGVHTVTVWRTQKDAPTVKLAGSEFTGQYVVGPVQPPPVCVAPQVLVNGVCVPPPPPTCVPPQVLTNGVCVTPPPVCTATQVLVNGICVPLPPPSCVPPKLLVNGACVDPPPLVVPLLVPGTYSLCREATPRVCSTFTIQP